jgi:hypothetical protein
MNVNSDIGLLAIRYLNLILSMLFYELFYVSVSIQLVQLKLHSSICTLTYIHMNVHETECTGAESIWEPFLKETKVNH